MRHVTLLALCLLLAGLWPHDSARAQTSAMPPVSLVPPDASPPRASAKNSRLPPAAANRETSPPVIGGLPSAPNPTADYDGFSVGTDDDEASSQAARPATSRAAKGSKPGSDTKGTAAHQLIDQEDEALKRKLTICKNCK